MLTSRGRGALALGGLLYLTAWAFGSRSLYPVATGLLTAVGLAWVWVRALAGPLELRRETTREHVEGESVPIRIEVDPGRRAVRPRALVVVDRIAGFGDTRLTVRAGDGRRALRGHYVLPAVPRGRYAVERTTALLEDPFGLARISIDLRASATLLVYPRLTPLHGLFSETGTHAHDGRRLLLRRPSGYDLHSVRPYERGESLRRVHWPSTARSGELMVKDLEDAPRDEVAVLLDTASPDVGSPPDSAFELQVRVAGSLLRVHAERSRRAVLVVPHEPRRERPLGGSAREWHRALELLASVRPGASLSAAALLAEETSAAARALDLTVVTSSLSAQLANRLVQRAAGRRPTALVVVDAASFVTASGAGVDASTLLHVASAGVATVVVRRGDDLAAKLSAPPRAAVAEHA